MNIKILSFLNKKTLPKSDFADFFTKPSSEKAKILRTVAKKASEEQGVIYNKFLLRNSKLVRN